MSSARLYMAAAVLAALVGCGGETTPPEPPHSLPATSSAATSTSAAPTSAPVPATAADLPPLPRVSFAPARPMAVVEAVFHFAAEHPEVLSHVPCFCGCESHGHKANDDCFVAARDQRGRVTAWEPHGIG